MTLPLAIFGLDGVFNMIAQLIVLAAIVIWLALVWYTFTDARRRLEDKLLIRSATIAALIFPLVGTVVYVIVRPPEYIEDRIERELEMEAAVARLASTDYQACPHCEEVVGGQFLRCPHCMRKLRDACVGCGKPLDPDWLLCPYCESEIEGVTPATKPRLPGQRERESAEVEPAEFNEPFDTDEVEAFDYASENPDTVTAEHAEAPPVDDLEERR
ncbi:MAG: zinc ribbon domain-containing protein [Actinomycetes bacterium]